MNNEITELMTNLVDNGINESRWMKLSHYSRKLVNKI